MEVFRFGLNDPAQFGWDDLIVEYFDQNLLVMVRGCMGPRVSVTGCLLLLYAKYMCFIRIPNSPLLISSAVAVLMVARSRFCPLTVHFECRSLII